MYAHCLGKPKCLRAPCAGPVTDRDGDLVYIVAKAARYRWGGCVATERREPLGREVGRLDRSLAPTGTGRASRFGRRLRVGRSVRSVTAMLRHDDDSTSEALHALRDGSDTNASGALSLSGCRVVREPLGGSRHHETTPPSRTTAPRGTEDGVPRHARASHSRPRAVGRLAGSGPRERASTIRSSPRASARGEASRRERGERGPWWSRRAGTSRTVPSPSRNSCQRERSEGTGAAL